MFIKEIFDDNTPDNFDEETLTTIMPQMYADPEQIERAIVNIVSNSLKYGAKGGYVNVAAGSMYNEVYIKVEDNGHGIPKADLEHVFDRFFRVDRARTREKEMCIRDRLFCAHRLRSDKGTFFSVGYRCNTGKNIGMAGL